MNNRKVRNECETHNNSVKKVIHKYSVYAEKFLASSNGNMLITGGDSAKRTVLIEKVINTVAYRDGSPVFVFGNNEHLKQKLIENAQKGLTGRLIVCSEEYKNYDCFYSMDSNVIADFFSAVAIEKGYRDTSELHDYIGAFLDTLQTKAPVSIASMMAFSKNSDTDIAAVARLAGNESNYEMILSSGRGGINFRRLLNSVYNALKNITASDCSTEFNLISAINANAVIYVDTNSIDYDILSLYFMYELKQLRGKEFTVVFTDNLMLTNEKSVKLFEILKQISNVKVVLSCENIMTVNDENRLNNFPEKIIYLNGNIPPNDLQQILNSLGEYTHFDATLSKGTPPRLFFSFKRTENYNVTPYSRSKILLEEEEGNEAVLSTHNSPQITVAQRLVI